MGQQRRFQADITVAGGDFLGRRAYDADPEEAFQQLKARRGLPEGLVALDQDRRIRRAMIALVAERGYDGVSVRDVTRRAGVSSKAFYRLYSGREECMVRCYDDLAAETARSLLAVAPRSLEPRRRLITGLRQFFFGLLRRPETARFALIECPAGGEQARHEVRRMEAIHAALLAQCLGAGPLDRPAEEMFRGCAVEGIAQVSRASLLGVRRLDPPAASTELAHWVQSLRSVLTTPPSPAPGSQRLGIGAEPDAADSDPTADVRRALIDAVLRIARRGTADQLTIDRVRFEAGASRRQFYATFPDLRACLTCARQFFFDECLRHALRNTLNRPRRQEVDPTVPERLFGLILRDQGTAAFILGARDEGRDGLRWETVQVSRLAALARREGHRAPGAAVYEAEGWVAAAWGVLRRSVDNELPILGHGVRRAHQLSLRA